MKMKIGVLIVSAAIIATAGIAFARDSGGNDEPAAAAAPMAPQVPVAEVLSRQIVPSAEFTGSASCSASPCCPPVHSPAHQVAGLPAMPVAVCGCLFPQAWVEAARQLEGLLRHLDWRLYSAKFYQLLG